MTNINAPAPTTIEDLRALNGPRFRWLVLVTVMVGMMASILSSTIVNVAVPDMSRFFGIGQDRAQWISAAFKAATTLSLLLTPWLLQRFGLRKTYVGATVLLMAGGIIGGLSGNYPVMIAMRVLVLLAAITVPAMIAAWSMEPKREPPREPTRR